MNELEKQIEEQKNEIEKQKNEIEELRSLIEDLTYRFERFAEPCAIGSEQLWEVVFNDILKRPVPAGVNLKDLI